MASAEGNASDMTAIMSSAAKAAPQTSKTEAAPASDPRSREEILNSQTATKRETFIPVTIAALVDRLAIKDAWPSGEARKAHRFFRYLEYWRRQTYTARMLELQPSYEPFSPDTDLLITRKYSEEEKDQMQARVIDEMHSVLAQANYTQVDPNDVQVILTKESHYGLDLHVDLNAFEECLLYYRGATTRRDTRRRWRKFMRREEFDVPIFQRLFVLFKLKPYEERLREIMKSEKLNRREAEKILKKLRALLPSSVSEDSIYMKLFKNIPRNDIEMCFPNTQVRFRMFDKVKLGVTAGGGLGVGAVGAAGKLALVASNPVAAAGAVAGLGAVAFRQFMSFSNQKQRYMVVMSQNLYFHSMADNHSAMAMLSDRAAEEDVKEEILLYSVLAKENAKHADLPAIDAAIEHYLQETFDITVDFDLEDALGRLIKDGVVREREDGTLDTMPPGEAAEHLDAQWDVFLD
ncbi:MAG: DUF3754 domain-containing protein, partial [Alphaproteobacteria bacterium]|nr:DUF3754 domain-containing protein [Alphaproteobacteria bacterium]